MANKIRSHQINDLEASKLIDLLAKIDSEIGNSAWRSSIETEYFVGQASLAAITVANDVIVDNSFFRVIVDGQEWYDSNKIAGGNVAVVYSTGVITPNVDWEGSIIKVIYQ